MKTYRKQITPEHIKFFVTKLDLDVVTHHDRIEIDEIIFLFEQNAITHEGVIEYIDEAISENCDLIEYCLKHDLPISRSITIYWIAHIIRFGYDGEDAIQ